MWRGRSSRAHRLHLPRSQHWSTRFPCKNIDWDSAPLGREPDTVIAKRYGVAHQVVHTARRRRGIPAYYGRRAARVREIAWEQHALGTKPDAAFAAELGVDRRTVAYHRGRLGIQPFVGLVLTQEGHPARSIYEAMFDAHLHDKAIDHEHEVRVREFPYIADFRVGDVYVEIPAMVGFEKYRRKVERKRRALSDARVPVLWVTPEQVVELFARCDTTLRFRNERSCEDCGAETHDIVKCLCRRCYMRRWHLAAEPTRSCDRCGAEIHRRDPGTRFCSRQCYWKSMEFDLPAWEELDARLADASVPKVARQLGVNANALYMRLRRRALRA